MAKTILVIDDEPGYRNMIQFEFITDGHTVLTAASGPEALEILKKGAVDMVITDMKMTPMDGLDTLIAIRGLYPGIPIVLMTGYAMEGRVQKALSMKASTCLQKPFHIKELRSVVDTIFS